MNMSKSGIRAMLDWNHVSANPSAGPLLLENLSFVKWSALSRNPAPEAVNLLLCHPEKIDVKQVSANPSDLMLSWLMQERPNSVDASLLSANPSSRAVEWLRNHPEEVHWVNACKNESEEVLGWLRLTPSMKWDMCLLSQNCMAEEFLREKKEEVCWRHISSNPCLIPRGGYLLR